MAQQSKAMQQLLALMGVDSAQAGYNGPSFQEALKEASAGGQIGRTVIQGGEGNYYAGNEIPITEGNYPLGWPAKGQWVERGMSEAGPVKEYRPLNRRDGLVSNAQEASQTAAKNRMAAGLPVSGSEPYEIPGPQAYAGVRSQSGNSFGKNFATGAQEAGNIGKSLLEALSSLMVTGLTGRKVQPTKRGR